MDSPVTEPDARGESARRFPEPDLETLLRRVSCACQGYCDPFDFPACAIRPLISEVRALRAAHEELVAALERIATYDFDAPGVESWKWAARDLKEIARAALAKVAP